MELHWLPVEFRVKFKILLQMFKVLNGHSPVYLSDLVSRYVPARPLRSSDCNLVLVPRTYSKYGDRRFSVSGPVLWNDLPENIRDADSTAIFKTLLKTHLYSKAFLE